MISSGQAELLEFPIDILAAPRINRTLYRCLSLELSSPAAAR
jgi:hypothetical protein